MATGGDIPKVQLESKEDVHFLQQQFSEFLEQTVDSNATLRDAGMTAEQRREAKQLVMDRLSGWTRAIWAMAGDSISVNGLAFGEAMSEQANMEALDEGLKGEVEALREEADALLLAVTERRRTVPGQIERLVADAVWRESVAADATAAIRGLRAEPADELPYIDGRVNGEFEAAARLAARVVAEAPETAARLRRLDETVRDTQRRAAAEAEDDRKVRGILLAGAPQPQSQLLAYKAALHAVK
ncbi:hypothetical protein H4R18_005228 [Coemansia javaensis]|uniref:Uncharacterized protein n=1 Tax=Coemansia javaensis TaxID=2761396 RepID=A0A9W8H6M0_9FUNG|nr:hypothetical protein H4R18_005228 [Coemansia javaensis]